VLAIRGLGGAESLIWGQDLVPDSIVGHAICLAITGIEREGRIRL
jgi:hypothetical protein